MFKIISTKLSDFKVSSTKRDYFPDPRPPSGLWTSSVGSGHSITGYMSDKFVYGIHKEKRRKVAKQSGKNSHKIISKACWITTIYKFPIERVKSFKQYARHFDVELY